MEQQVVEKEGLKGSIISKVDELVDCVQRLGKTDFFQITVKYVNGELITRTDFSDNNSISMNKES